MSSSSVALAASVSTVPAAPVVASAVVASVSVVAPVTVQAPTLKELKVVLGRYNDDWRMIHVDPAEVHSASSLAAARAREQATVDDAIRLSPVFRALSAKRQVALLTASSCCRSIAAEGALISTLSSAQWRAYQDARVAAEEEEAAIQAAIWDAQADWAEWNSRYD
jgi:hypothetical protein